MYAVRAAAAAMVLAASGASAQPRQFDAATAFGAREAVLSISISPDGRSIAYLEPIAGQGARLVVTDLANPQPRAIASVDGEEQRLANCRFASNQRIICTAFAIVQLNGAPTGVQRLVSIDKTSGASLVLGERDTRNQLYQRTYGGSVLDYLPGDADAVLMQQTFVPEQTTGTLVSRSGEGLGVVRVDTTNGRSSRVESPRGMAVGYITDGRGHVRITAVQATRSSSEMGSTVQYLYRRGERGSWEEFGTYDSLTERGPLPIAVDPTLNVAYVLESLNGRKALYRISLDGSLRRELVVSSDRVDVDGVIQIGRSHRVVGATYATERRETVYFDPEVRGIAEQLHRTLPNAPLINVEDATEDESKLVIFAGSDNDSGRYYLFDRASRSMAEILPARPQLAGVALAQVRPITYRAADGTEVPAYLTLPPGSDGRNLPAIVMPHGGPGARDEWGFDWLSQYFANRGYAVLQPNFRGSSGYGESWFQNNGFRSWRLAIGDVNDAGRWLVAQGIADPSKLAIVGWSYGGYAALQSNVLDPGLFKAVVAVAPVTDIEVLRAEFGANGNGRNARDFFGTGPHLHEGSPAQNAEVIRAPVLMFHGTSDLNVSVAQSRLMDDRLRRAGHPSELIIYQGRDHQLDDAAARTDMLRRTDTFIRHAIGLPALAGAAPTSAAN